MRPEANETSLADRQHVTLIVRLTLDPKGRLLQGELLDTTYTHQQRFIGVAGLNKAVQDWLTQHVHTEDAT
jgi:hypothetical protein